ncbi:hypothetical protein [Paraflavitalea sp. CAU 1676]|uniref:hypothetical protein n=1 Tax=Paraflavitalea sp. CAU 1676 TaxID=3032598 RepID=UPI0023DC6937|nr:hypothetical protein [Paraflavitalea sp. CAU 1676]MDF2187543.1 hypothetical protein [Paraflavitalea sp. CAU 1676]
MIYRFCSYMFWLLCIAVLPAAAQKSFDFNTNCRLAYKEIIQLRLENGQRMLDAEKLQHPDNLIPHFLENYIDFFTLFFNEDPAEYKKRIDNVEERIELMSEGPDSSPFYLYTKSVLHFQGAAIRVKFGERWDAGWEFRRSYLQSKENLKSFPSFGPNQLYYGAMQMVTATIPDGYKWLSNLLGMKGNMKGGMERVRQFLYGKDEWSQLFHEEAVFYYCYLQFYLNNDKKGVAAFIGQQQLDVVNNNLFSYLAANLSLNSQQAEKAEEVLNARNRAPAYLVSPVWDLEMGYAKLHHLEPDAHIYFENFIRQFKGKFYVKDVLLKLSWHYYLQNDQGKADWYRKEILKRGNTDTDADKLAQKEGKSTRWPNRMLLQARLLNDGGYHREALRLLHGKTTNDFPVVEERLEFAYRVGRLYDDIGAYNEAIPFYKEAIGIGETRKEYFAARAALHIGFIYEGRNDKKTAITWFEKCIGMKDHDFKNSLDQRAKAGIGRCKE